MDVYEDKGYESGLPCHASDDRRPSASYTSAKNNPRRVKAGWKWAATFLLVFPFVVAAIYNLSNPDFRNHFGPEERRPARRPCGENAFDAQRLGCTFDLPNFSWLPEDCIDRDLSREFLAAQPEWDFFLDRNKTTRVSIEDVSQGTWEYFITGRVHVAHCTFTWVHFQKALSEGRKVHGQNNMDHTWHCSGVLRQEREDIEEVEIRVKVAYPDCGYLSQDYPG